jgi:hypothetical protein
MTTATATEAATRRPVEVLGKALIAIEHLTGDALFTTERQ